jgi:DNA (cytosine-5)-methyltransferase 1
VSYRLLDLFCGAGGCARGYADAGFEVTGVDIVPQPHYPYTFIQADALTYPLDGFDVIHASPPCERFTMMLNHGIGSRESHPDYIEVIRQRLQATGKPYIIENVPGAPVERMIMLCGAMFGLRVYRHRYFESNVLLFQPGHPRHLVKVAHASRIPRDGEFWSAVGCFGQKDDAQRAMGIDWMKTTGSRDTEIAQAIPPAYTRWIGEQLMAYLVAVQEVGA